MHRQRRLYIQFSRAAAIGFTALSFGTGCHSASKKVEVPVVESPSTGAAATPVTALGPSLELSVPNEAKGSTTKVLAKPLTSTGENSQGRFSPDGSRIIFISRARPMHKQAQVYEMHLGLMREKRLTFHDGDDSAPTYAPDGQRMLFASTTDSIKEDPFVGDQLMQAYNPQGLQKRSSARATPAFGSEIYEQSLNGRFIERLTKSLGFDGDPDVEPRGIRAVYSSSRDSSNGAVHLYIQSGKNQSRLTTGAFIDRGARYAPDGKGLAFARRAIATASGPANGAPGSHIAVTEFANQKILEVTTGESMDLSPSWLPGTTGDIIFSSNRDGKFYNLYLIDRQGTCLRRLTEAAFDQLEPAFSPDGKQILFTGQKDGSQQLYTLPFQRPTECRKATVMPTTARTPAPAAGAAMPTPGASPTPEPLPQ